MEHLTVLSPHRDDAVFSLGLTLSYLSTRPIALNVLNFFTVSAYAPYSSAKSVKDVSEVRRQEDLHALEAVHPAISEMSLDLLDAPLRPGIQFDQIMQPSTAELLTEDHIDALAQHIRLKCHGHLLIAPLAIGDHVDHSSVFRAALRSGNPELAFYEDLPYTAKASPDEVEKKLAPARKQLAMTFVPVIFSVPDPIAKKTKLAATYSSQIKPEVAEVIAGFAGTYGGGERVWIPETSTRWRALAS